MTGASDTSGSELRVAAVDFTTYGVSVQEALRSIGAGPLLAGQRRIIIKPNLINLSPLPTTSDPRCIRAVAAFCRQHSPTAELLVAEGSGGASTLECYRQLGYEKLLDGFDVSLIDIDHESTVELSDDRAGVFKTLHLPESIVEGFLISVPVLKDHSICRVTLGLKNLIGFLPERFYSGYWSYKRSMVHKVDVERAIVDLNLYRPIQLTVIDAAIGQRRSHLDGPPADPPVRKIVAGRDPVEVDKVGARLLGHRWQEIEHLRIADRRLPRIHP